MGWGKEESGREGFRSRTTTATTSDTMELNKCLAFRVGYSSFDLSWIGMGFRHTHAFISEPQNMSREDVMRCFAICLFSCIYLHMKERVLISNPMSTLDEKWP